MCYDKGKPTTCTCTCIKLSRLVTFLDVIVMTSSLPSIYNGQSLGPDPRTKCTVLSLSLQIADVISVELAVNQRG